MISLRSSAGTGTKQTLSLGEFKQLLTFVQKYFVQAAPGAVISPDTDTDLSALDDQSFLFRFSLAGGISLVMFGSGPKISYFSADAARILEFMANTTGFFIDPASDTIIFAGKAGSNETITNTNQFTTKTYVDTSIGTTAADIAILQGEVLTLQNDYVTFQSNFTALQTTVTGHTTYLATVSTFLSSTAVTLLDLQNQIDSQDAVLAITTANTNINTTQTNLNAANIITLQGQVFNSATQQYLQEIETAAQGLYSVSGADFVTAAVAASGGFSRMVVFGGGLRSTTGSGVNTAWAIPLSVTKIKVTVVGAGGGGYFGQVGSGITYFTGSGGNAGATAVGIFTIDTTCVITYQFGLGGIGGNGVLAPLPGGLSNLIISSSSSPLLNKNITGNGGLDANSGLNAISTGTGDFQYEIRGAAGVRGYYKTVGSVGWYPDSSNWRSGSGAPSSHGPTTPGRLGHEGSATPGLSGVSGAGGSGGLVDTPQVIGVTTIGGNGGNGLVIIEY